MVADSSGLFREITPKDQQTPNTNDNNTSTYIDGQNTGGTPNSYDKTANAIFLDPIPNYNYNLGLKVFINREPSYFTYTDTTKKPGVHGDLHRYFAIKPALDYARRKNTANLNSLIREVALMEQKIAETYSERPKDEVRRLRANVENNR